MSARPRLAYVLLAAGASRRFGGVKQLASLDFKKTLLENSLEYLLETSPGEVHLVLGAHREKIQQQLDFHTRYPRVNLVINEKWETGIASSVRAAVDEVLGGEFQGLLLVLADQVAIKAQHLKEMRELWYTQPDKIVASQFSGILGAPAIFPRSFFKALRQLRGDKGAKDLLRDSLQHVLPFQLSEAKIDIDTERQLNNWQLETL